MSSDEEFYDLYNQRYGLTVDEVKNLREEWFINKPDDDVSSNVENLIIWMKLLSIKARKGKDIIEDVCANWKINNISKIWNSYWNGN